MSDAIKVASSPAAAACSRAMSIATSLISTPVTVAPSAAHESASLPDEHCRFSSRIPPTGPIASVSSGSSVEPPAAKNSGGWQFTRRAAAMPFHAFRLWAVIARVSAMRPSLPGAAIQANRITAGPFVIDIELWLLWQPPDYVDHGGVGDGR